MKICVTLTPKVYVGAIIAKVKCMQAHYVLSITYIVLGITIKQVYLCVQVLGQRWESVRLWIDSSNVSLCSEIIIIPRVGESTDYGMGRNQFVACHPNF